MRKPGTYLLLAALAVGVALISSPGYAARTDPGSFLSWTVSSPDELAQQIKTNATVGNRYASFYKSNRSTVAERFEGLTYRPLQSDITTRTYFVSKNGRVSSKMKTYRKGTYMFFNSEGKPVLDGKCGNPVRTELPVAVPEETTSITEEMTEPPAVAEGAEAPLPTQVAEAPLMQPEPVTTQVLAQPAEVIAPAVATTPTESIAAAAGGGGGSLLPLLLLPLLAGGGGGGDNVIPEPGAIVTLGTGLMAFGAMAIRKRKA